MKTMTLGWIAALGITGSVFGFVGCSQPTTECQIGLASTGYSYVAKYKVKNEAQLSDACKALIKPGETFGMEFYHPASSDKTTYDGSKSTLALGSDDISNMAAAYDSVGVGDPCTPTVPCAKDEECGDPSLKCNSGYCTAKECSGLHAQWGLGAFKSSEPDQHDICAVDTTSVSEQDLSELVDTEGAGVADTTCTTDEDCRADTGIACEKTEDCDIVFGQEGVATCGKLGPAMDSTCIDAASGAVCDKTAGKCVVGCRATDAMGMPAATGCVYPFGCTSGDDQVGECKLPAVSAKYEWKNLKFYVTAAAPGTQFSGDLTYTQDGCEIQYTAVGLWPAVGCATDADCSPCANPDAGVTIGSGISPDFPIKCDTDLGICVLADAKDTKKDADSIPQILEKSVDCGPVE